MAKKVLFQTATRQYQKPYYPGVNQIELETSNNSLLSFHVLRTPYYDPRAHNANTQSGDAVSKGIRNTLNNNRSPIEVLLSEVTNSLNAGIKAGMDLYSRILSVKSANPNSVKILLDEGKE